MKHLLSILLLSTLSFSLPSIECKAKTVVNKTPTETPANEGEEDTGIEEVEMVEGNKNTVYFNLQGQQVSSPKSGEIYIKNGKKFMQK